MEKNYTKKGFADRPTNLFFPCNAKQRHFLFWPNEKRKNEEREKHKTLHEAASKKGAKWTKVMTMRMNHHRYVKFKCTIGLFANSYFSMTFLLKSYRSLLEREVTQTEHKMIISLPCTIIPLPGTKIHFIYDK